MRDNLILRQHTYHVRLAIPESVRPFFGGRKLLSKSLKTGLEREARDRARGILLQWKAEIDAAKSGKASELEDVLDIASQAGTRHATMISEAVKGVLTGSGEQSSAPLEGVEALVEEISKAASDGLIPNAGAVAVLHMLKDAIELRGAHESEVPDADKIQLLSSLRSSRMTEIFRAVLDDVELPTTTKTQALAAYHQPKSYKPRSPITTARLDSFRTHLERKGTAAKTVDQVCRRVALFSSYLAKHGHPLTFDTVSAYLDQLTDKAGNPLTAKTKKQHVWSGSLFWKWACKYDADWRDQYKGQPSPFADHDLPVIKGESSPWEAFTKEDVEKLHALALEKKDQPLADLICIGAHSGARLEECGRIRRENITFNKDGVPIAFAVEESKTAAGVRVVPIHHKIAGLVQSLLDSSPDGYLLPGGNNKYGNRLDALGKRFGRLKTAAGFDKQFVFHSIRKTAITLVHQAGADVAVMPGLFGHETGMITFDLYSQGPSLEQKAKVIGLLSFDFP